MHEFREETFTEEQRAIREKLRDQWRMACPKGHTLLNLNKVPTVYCLICDRAYAYGDLVDRY